MKALILIKKGCEKCVYGKELHKKLLSKNIPSQLLDIEEADGMVEAMFYGITTTPYILTCDRDNNIRRYNSVFRAEKEIMETKEELLKEESKNENNS